MEIKAELIKPYTENQKMDFIVEQNHNNSYEIKETETALEAWGYTVEEKLNEAKTSKYNEINNGARIYLESGEALFELSENQHIEATDGNIGKLSAYALSYITGTLTPSDAVYWNTKEDETIALTQEQLTRALIGLGEVQATVWNVKFSYYLKQLENATTVEEVKAINVDYSLPIPEETEVTNEEIITNDSEVAQNDI